MSDTLLETEDAPILDHDAREECSDLACPCHEWVRQKSAKEVTAHQPAARGGGDGQWYGIPDEGGNYDIYEHGGKRVARACSMQYMQQICNEHNQHQSLVAERERLRAAIEVAIHNLNAGNDPKFLADYLQLTLDQQRSTSE